MAVDLTWLPRGRGLAEPDFELRHRLIVWVLALHLPALVLYAVLTHHSFDQGLLAVTPVVVLLVGALLPGPRLRRGLAASVGLLVASAVLVHLSGGLLEMHFHYFVAVALIALYQEWIVYATAIVFVLVEHGVLGQTDHQYVYDHRGDPWVLAGVHAGFICAMAVVQVSFWRFHERARANEEHYRRELYDGQESLVARLEDAAQLRSDLVGTVTHEFRTPLTGISAALLTLRRRRHRLDELKVDELLDAALLHAERLRRLLENMLTAAEATAVDPVVVTDVVATTTEILDALPQRQRTRLSADLPEALPAHIGREALHQVLANLIDNALTHSPPGTTVQLCCGRVGGDAVIRLRNAGANLLPARIAHLLEPFTQADGSATRTREGAGMGLYVVRRLVEVHGGQLTLQSGDGVITVEVNVRASVVPDTPGSLVDSIVVPRTAMDQASS